MLAGKIKSKKMRGMKMTIATCFGDRTISKGRSLLLIVSVSRTDNFMNVFYSILLPFRFCTISS